MDIRRGSRNPAEQDTQEALIALRMRNHTGCLFNISIVHPKSEIHGEKTKKNYSNSKVNIIFSGD